MGNCCTVDYSSDDWAGDDWGSLTSKHKSKSSLRKVFDENDHEGDHRYLGNVEKEMLFGKLRASSDENGKVKIMISKKELERLLKGNSSDSSNNSVDHHHHASAELVLARLIYAKDHYDHQDLHHRHWKPVLQTIPEVN